MCVYVPMDQVIAGLTSVRHTTKYGRSTEISLYIYLLEQPKHMN